MREKRSAEPASQANLRVPKEEAAQKIIAQIKKGNDIRNLRIDPVEDLEKAQRERSKWSSYNIELLKRLFDTTSLAEEYQLGVSLPIGDLFEDQVERFRADVADDIATLESILDRLDLMTTTTATVSGVDAIQVTREGMFFGGQYFDALQGVKGILLSAQRSLVIIDGYLSEDVLNILTSKGAKVELKILTKEVQPALHVAAKAFNKQYGILSIHTSTAFHDRFVIVDDRDFYHFGASIKDLGHRAFMFSRIEEPEVIDALRAKWLQEWASSTVVV